MPKIKPIITVYRETLCVNINIPNATMHTEYIRILNESIAEPVCNFFFVI